MLIFKIKVIDRKKSQQKQKKKKHTQFPRIMPYKY